MWYSDVKTEDNQDLLEGLVFHKTIEEVNKLQEKFNKEVFSALCYDIENWLYERFDNVRRQYFDEIVAYLLGTKHTYIEDEETLERWLSGIGYDAEIFRRKIYQENKDIINKAITQDAIYETLERIFKYNHFKDWTFKDISARCPQSNLVKEFLRLLIQKDGFNEEVTNMLDEEINKKIEYIDYLNEKITDTKNQLKEIF